MTTIKITYGGESVTLTCDLAQASAPLLVDGEPIGRQTADARHRAANAVLLAARATWPEAAWPAVPTLGDQAIEENEAWDELAYEAA